MNKQKILDCVKLAKHAYASQKNIPWEEFNINHVGWIQDRKTDTQGFVASAGSDIYIVWRGSESPTDFLKDASVIKTSAFNCRVHSGFNSCLEAVSLKLYKLVKQAIQDIGGPYEVSNIYISGHSLGGALATLSAVKFAHWYPSMRDRIKVVTIGSPRVGDRAFRNLFNKHISECVRIVHDNDIVTRVPKLNYFHVKGQLKLADDGTVMTNSLNPIKAITRIVKANITADSVKDHSADKYVKAVELWDGTFSK
jgi:triacylglycerol lipase